MAPLKRVLPATTLAACAFLSATATPASAELTVCNRYSYDLYFAFGILEGSRWTSYGWYEIGSRDCEVVYTGALRNQYFYVYGEPTEDGIFDEGETLFNGRAVRFTQFCVHEANAFTLPENAPCTAEGYERRDFAEVNTGGYTRYRLDLLDD